MVWPQSRQGLFPFVIVQLRPACVTLFIWLVLKIGHIQRVGSQARMKTIFFLFLEWPQLLIRPFRENRTRACIHTEPWWCYSVYVLLLITGKTFVPL